MKNNASLSTASALPVAIAKDPSLWRYAMALAWTALTFGLLLGGLSAWFLGSVALAGLSATAFTFNFHIPGALVRLFAVGRTVAKYGERLVGHKAALADQVARRVDLFRAMADAPAIRRTGWQLGDEAKLADYLDDVEDLDYAKLRVDLPAATLGAGLIGGLVATTIVAPLALVPIGLVLVVVVVSMMKLARAGAIAWEQRRALQREGAQRLGMAMASTVPLQAEGAWHAAITGALASLGEAEQVMLGISRRQAGVDAVAALLGPIALLGIVGAAWWTGLQQEALLVPVFLAFSWFALGEAITSVSRILVARFRRQAAQAEIGAWTKTAAPALKINRSASAPLEVLRATALQRRAPDGRAIGRPISLCLQAGRPTIFAGASGCGKTSLLKQIAGWTGDDTIAGGAEVLSAAARRRISCLCPHDAAILADTWRANLFALSASDDELWRALEAVEMNARVEQDGGLDSWVAQDVLSLGEAQRLNLARAFLSDRPLVLLDEPTEHIDDAQAARILNRVLPRLQDRIVVLSSHRAFDLPHATTIPL
jgi:ABC-type transport system involved in cytochrome bd biosynthesis fused ATPase/permease subunit